MANGIITNRIPPSIRVFLADATWQALTSSKPLRRWTADAVDLVFKKQLESESRIEEMNRKLAEDWYRNKWLREKIEKNFPNDILAKDRRWREDRRSQVAGARFEAREIPKHISRRNREKYLEVLKLGILAGRIEICETPTGFEIISPRQRVWEYVREHPEFKDSIPRPEYLEEGGFLLGIVDKVIKERVKLLRDNLIAEFHADTPSDYMLIDLAVANYVRAMQAINGNSIALVRQRPFLRSVRGRRHWPATIHPRSSKSTLESSERSSNKKAKLLVGSCSCHR